MNTTTIVLVEFIVQPFVLAIGLKFFKIQYKWWELFVASLLAALCMYIPNSAREVIGFVVLLAAMRYFTDANWGDIIYPVAVARLALFLALLLVKVS